MRVGIYAGSFDPFTIGHEDIVRRSLSLFDGVIIAIGVHPAKKPILTMQDRKVMIEQTFKDEPNISVQAYGGLLADFIEEVEDYDDESELFLIRGLRDENDFQAESKLAFANKKITTSNNETVFIITDPALAHVSSTLVRELMSYERDCREFVPDKVWEIIQWRKEHPGTLLLDNDVKELVAD